MAANDCNSLPQRENNKRRKNKGHETVCFNELKEIFGATFDSDVLISVAQSCQYDLNASTTALLKMTEAEPEAKESESNYDPWRDEKLPWEQETDNNFNNDNKNNDPESYFSSAKGREELRQQREKFAKFEAAKKADNTNENSQESRVGNNDGIRKTGTTSLCGLKVQYRPKGSKNQSDDDDVDVVVEDESESSDDSQLNTPQHNQNSNFISSPFSPTQSTQCPPTNTFSQLLNMTISSSSTTQSAQHQWDNQSIHSRIYQEIDSGYKVVILLRGVPGSGKSYLARSIIDRTPGATYNSYVFSADDYFLRSGVYKYDPTQLTKAHLYCQRNAYQAMKEGRSPIIIDNTNTQAWEMQPYASAAVAYGYVVETMEPQTAWFRKVNELDKKNTHGVPRDKIKAMLERYEWNINGERLLKISKLTYEPHNKPPQMRRWPRFEDTQRQTQSCITTSRVQQNVSHNVAVQLKTVDEPNVVTSRSFVEESRITSEALDAIAREYSEMQIECAESSATPESLSKENGSIDAKKSDLVEIEKTTSISLPDKEESTIATSLDSKTKVQAVSTEESSAREKIEDYEEKEQDDSNGNDTPIEAITVSKCRDFTVFINGTEQHSKFSDEFMSLKDFANGGDQAVFVNDGQFTYLIGKTNTKDKPLVTSNSTEQKPMTNDSEESTSQSDNSSSNSKGSSFERISDVDITSLDSGDIEFMTDLELKKIVDMETADNFLDIIKKDLSEFENDFCQAVGSTNEEENRQTDEILQTSNEVGPFEPTSLTTNIASNHEINVKQNDEHDVECDFGSRTSNIQQVLQSIEAQLQEATTDFQLLEQLDYSEERRLFEPVEDNEELSTSEQDNKIKKQMKNFQYWDNCEKNVSKEPINKVLGENISPCLSSCDLFINNAEDTVNWNESSSSSVNEVVTKPSTMDSSTFTDPYDFNVAYLGGVDGYKVINAVSRSINDSIMQSANNDCHHVPLKFALDKGTMTNNSSFICSDTSFNLEDDVDSEDRSAEFLERFSHLPQELLLDVYHKLCQRNFDWAVDYIKHLHSRDILNYEKTESSINNSFDYIPTDTSCGLQKSSSSELSLRNSPDPPKQTPKKKKDKKNKCLVFGDKLALKQEIESKFQISEESYPSHVLRVKRWKNREFDEPTAPIASVSFDNEIPSYTNANPVIEQEETIALQPDQEPVQLEEEYGFEDEEETVELKVGFEVIKQLEDMFGSVEFDNDGLFPVIQLPKFMAQQLHNFWIETMYQQFQRMQEQLDLMITQDAEFAKSLLNEPENFRDKPEVPNLKEIMEMEMALAIYKNNKRKHKKELPTDIAQRVTQDTLYEMYPNFDRKIVLDIYEAHDKNFEETVKILDENSPFEGRMTMADVVKKRKNLIDELHKESNTSSQYLCNNLEGTSASGYDDDEKELISYDKAMKIAHLSRLEARKHIDLRNQNFCKAQEAYRKKHHDVAVYYSDVAKLHLKNVEKANEAAASAYLAAQLHSKNSNTLDLHFLHVSEAVEGLCIHLDTQFENMKRGSYKHIFVITGRGSRSTSGRSKIKPAVAKELNKRNITFYEVNPGMLRIVLRKK